MYSEVESGYGYGKGNIRPVADPFASLLTSHYCHIFVSLSCPSAKFQGNFQSTDLRQYEAFEMETMTMKS